MSFEFPARLAVTGAAGALGTVLRAHLADAGIDTISLDIREPARLHPNETFLRCDLADADAVAGSLRGAAAVVHLGGISTTGPFEAILSANIRGSFHVFEAARRHAMRRVVYASSNHVTGYYASDERVRPDMPHRPDSFYGLSKAFGEDLARLYWDKYGVESVGLRIGSCFERPRDRRMLKTWLSHRDFVRLVERALVAPGVGHSVVYGVSANPETYWEADPAGALGFTPRDSSAACADALPDDQREPPRQGGGFVDVDETMPGP